VIKSVSFDAADALALATFWAAVFGSDVDEELTADEAFVEAAGWDGPGAGRISGSPASRLKNDTAELVSGVHAGIQARRMPNLCRYEAPRAARSVSPNPGNQDRSSLSGPERWTLALLRLPSYEPPRRRYHLAGPSPRPSRTPIRARLAATISVARLACRSAGTRAGRHGDSTTHRDRYQPDGPTARASTMPCLAVRTSGACTPDTR
jgi:hypothetical protein